MDDTQLREGLTLHQEITAVSNNSWSFHAYWMLLSKRGFLEEYILSGINHGFYGKGTVLCV